MRAISVAFHHLPVGHMFSIKNAQEIPDKYFQASGKPDWNVFDVYHGASAHAIPDIMSRGLTPTLGAGAEALQAQFGLPVPGVYVARSWHVASNYPIEPTTGPIEKNSAGVSGGSYVALDGSPPLRAVVRCLVKSDRQLWHRGNSQSLYMPQDLFITHISFYATHRDLAHLQHKGLELHNFNLDDDALIPYEHEDSSFVAQSASITWKLGFALEQKTVGQQQFQRAPPPMRALVVASNVEAPYSEQLENAARMQRLESEKRAV